MSGYLGSFAIDETCIFYANTHTPATGAAVDADAAPGYRVYEDETGTPILTGTMALLDDANTVGFYSEQLTLSAANGFEAGKSYCVRMTLVVSGVTGIQLQTFQIRAAAVGALTTTERTAIGTALLDLANGIETGLTLRQAQRLIAAACAGKASGLATTTATYRNAVADSKDRLVATVSPEGNRTAIVYDVS